KTILSRNATSTRSRGRPSRAGAAGIKTGRRFLRVIARSTFQTEFPRERLDARDCAWIARKTAFCIDERRARLAWLVEHRIGANKAKPAFKILPILRQARGEAIHHAANGIHP